MAPSQSQPIDVERFLTREGKDLSYGQLRKLLVDFTSIPGVIGLHGGLPPGDAFPLASLSYTTVEGDKVSLDDAELYAAQQYVLPSAGLPALREWSRQHVIDLHAPARPDVETVIVAGATQGLSAFFSLFLERGDVLFVEEVSYSQVTEALAVPKGVRVLPVPMDADGALPEALDAAIAELAEREPRTRVKALYTIPTCQNPTGLTTPAARRQALYQVCRRRDILILEDDPYIYLQLPARDDAPVPGLRGLPRNTSYLHLDTDGRVFRIDSCAKFLAPGVRAGWVTVAPALVEPLSMALQAQTLGPCALSQVLTHSLLARWGEEGLHVHLERIQRIYLARLQTLLAAAERHLAGLATWRRPSGGMFLWITVPGLEDTRQLMSDLVEARVVAPPGGIFHPTPGTKNSHIRLAFSFEPADKIEQAIERLGRALRAWKERTSAQ